MTARSALLKNLDRPVGVDNEDSSHDFDSGIEKGIGYPFLSRVLKKSKDHVFHPSLSQNLGGFLVPVKGVGEIAIQVPEDKSGQRLEKSPFSSG